MLQIVYNLAEEFLKHRSSFGLYLSVFEKSAASSRRVGTPIHQGSLGFPGMVAFGGRFKRFLTLGDRIAVSIPGSHVPDMLGGTVYKRSG